MTTQKRPSDSSQVDTVRRGTFLLFVDRRRLSPTLCACLALALCALAASCLTAVECIDCFRCSSRNGNNRACEDPFHNLNSTRVTTPALPANVPLVTYHTPCYTGKKNRDGLFPASACIKITGTFVATGETLVVRHCAVDSGTLTQDTEIARMSHCGRFNFNNDSLMGCVLACGTDGCNPAARAAIADARLVAALCFAATVLFTRRHSF